MTAGAARITLRRLEHDARAVAAATVVLKFGGRRVRLTGCWVEKGGTIFKWRVPTATPTGEAKRTECFALDDDTARAVELAALRLWERQRLEIGRHHATTEVVLPSVGEHAQPRQRHGDWREETAPWA